MTAEQGIEHPVAQLAACKLLDLLSPCCERIEVAGSIRRRKPIVKDIEIVALPKRVMAQPDLFGGTGDLTRNLLDERCDELLAAGMFRQRRDKNGSPRWGSGYHAIVFDEFPVDLFAVMSPSNWGGILAIRTGPGDFNQLLMTSRFQGGAMPANMRQLGGALTRGGVPLSTYEEADWFEAIGVPFWEPHERSAERLQRYLKQDVVRR